LNEKLIKLSTQNQENIPNLFQ